MRADGFPCRLEVASVIALGSAINNALVELGDRRREISTLRVLGYHPWQVASILFRQSMITWIAGLALGCPMGYYCLVLIFKAYDTELYRLPVVVRPHVLMLTVGASLVFVLIAQAIVYLQIRKMDWLEGIQIKE